MYIRGDMSRQVHVKQVTHVTWESRDPSTCGPQTAALQHVNKHSPRTRVEVIDFSFVITHVCLFTRYYRVNSKHCS